MKETLSAIMSSHNSSRIYQDDSAQASIFGVPILLLGGAKMKINGTDDELALEVHKALSSIGFTGKIMKRDSDILPYYFF